MKNNSTRLSLMKAVMVIIDCICLCACAVTPKVTRQDDDTYLMTVDSVLEEASASEIAIEKANEYCTGLAGEIEITDLQHMPTTKGNSTPVTHVTFRCANRKLSMPSSEFPRNRGRHPADRLQVWPGK